MYNFNNEERDVYEMYKGESEEETMENLQKGLAVASEEAKPLIISVIEKI